MRDWLPPDPEPDPASEPFPSPAFDHAPPLATDAIPGVNGRVERRRDGLHIEWFVAFDTDLAGVECIELSPNLGDNRIQLFLRLRGSSTGPGIEARILFEPEYEAALRGLREQVHHAMAASVAPAVHPVEDARTDPMMSMVYATEATEPSPMDEVREAISPPAMVQRPLPRVLPSLDVTLTIEDEAWICFAPLRSAMDLILAPEPDAETHVLR